MMDMWAVGMREYGGREMGIDGEKCLISMGQIGIGYVHGVNGMGKWDGCEEQ